MKIYVNYDYDNHEMIRGVQTLDYYLGKGKTEEEINAALVSSNKADGFERFRCFELPDELVPVFRFSLGEKEYKHYSDITDLYNVLRDLNDNIESIQTDCYDACNAIEASIKRVENLVPEEDR